MWFISEIVIEKKLEESRIISLCELNNVKIRHYWGNNNKHLGIGISNEDFKKIFNNNKDSLKI